MAYSVPVTSHAILRYVERVMGLHEDVEAVRVEGDDGATLNRLAVALPGFDPELVAQKIWEDGGQQLIKSRGHKYLGDGFVLVAQNGCIVTVFDRRGRISEKWLKKSLTP